MTVNNEIGVTQPMGEIGKTDQKKPKYSRLTYCIQNATLLYLYIKEHMSLISLQ